jgi:protein disulfide-isomerase
LGGDELRVPQHRESNLQWLESWEIASSQAARDGKLVMADFTGSDWCSWCKKLDREVFSTTEFSAWAASNVVLLKVDFPRNTRQDPQIQQLNEELAKKYATHIGGYPTVLFLRPDGSVAGTIGYEAGGPEAWIHKAEKSMHSAP